MEQGPKAVASRVGVPEVCRPALEVSVARTGMKADKCIRTLVWGPASCHQGGRSTLKSLEKKSFFCLPSVLTLRLLYPTQLSSAVPALLTTPSLCFHTGSRYTFSRAPFKPSQAHRHSNARLHRAWECLMQSDTEVILTFHNLANGNNLASVTERLEFGKSIWSYLSTTSHL